MRPIYLILIALLVLTAVFAAGCSAKPLDGPIALSEFAYYHNGMSSADGYSFRLSETTDGTLFAFSLNSGAYEAELTVPNGALEELGAIAAEHRIDRWDGFDKVDKNVSDGEGFTLSFTAKDGSTCSAHGSNAFPKGYHEAEEPLLAVFRALVAEYAPEYLDYIP